VSTSLETIFEELRHNLFRSYVFYLPGKLVEEAPIREEQLIKLAPLFDTILYIDTELVLNSYKQQPLQFELQQKRELLNKNTFKLLLQKDIQKPYQFDFLIKEYIKYVEFNLVATKWLLQQLDRYLPNTTKEIKIVLQLQCDCFKKHQQDIDQHLKLEKQLPNENINLLEFVSNNFKDLNDKISNIQINKPIATAVSTTVDVAAMAEKSANPSNSTQKKKKTPLITDEEARKYLLKTVFNVK
jgi:hypothetical protein